MQIMSSINGDSNQMSLLNKKCTKLNLLKELLAKSSTFLEKKNRLYQHTQEIYSSLNIVNYSLQWTQKLTHWTPNCDKFVPDRLNSAHM